jgi:hypothetical protein
MHAQTLGDRDRERTGDLERAAERCLAGERTGERTGERGLAGERLGVLRLWGGQAGRVRAGAGRRRRWVGRGRPGSGLRGSGAEHLAHLSLLGDLEREGERRLRSTLGLRRRGRS